MAVNLTSAIVITENLISNYLNKNQVPPLSLLAYYSDLKLASGDTNVALNLANTIATVEGMIQNYLDKNASPPATLLAFYSDLKVSSGAVGGSQLTNTDALPEGSLNKYYTDARADARIAAQKAIASGLASLDATGKIPPTQLPAIAITETFVVNNQAAQIALTAQVGDVAVRTDLNKSFILSAEPASTLINWQELLTPTDSVTSVAGKTGAVTLDNNDIGGLGTAATQNVPASGNAAATEVVRGDDTRLTDARSPSGTAGGNLSGTYPNPAIANNAVTYAKMQNVIGNRFLGNPAGTTAAPSEISLASNSGLAFLGNTVGLSGWTSFTPTLRGAATAGSFTYSASTYGRYVRFNNVCIVQGRLAISAIATAATGQMQISLPIASSASSPASAIHPTMVLNNNAATNPALSVAATTPASTSNANLAKVINGVLSAVNPSEVGNNFDVCFFFAYVV